VQASETRKKTKNTPSPKLVTSTGAQFSCRVVAALAPSPIWAADAEPVTVHRAESSSGMPTTRRLQARRLMLRPCRLPSAALQGSRARLSVWCSTPAALRIWVGCCGSGACRMWRERPAASAPLPALANTEQTPAANETVDAGLEGLGRLDQHGLGAPPQCSNLHSMRPQHTPPAS
jgi:hypothetical protein